MLRKGDAYFISYCVCKSSVNHSNSITLSCVSFVAHKYHQENPSITNRNSAISFSYEYFNAKSLSLLFNVTREKPNYCVWDIVKVFMQIHTFQFPESEDLQDASVSYITLKSIVVLETISNGRFFWELSHALNSKGCVSISFKGRTFHFVIL